MKKNIISESKFKNLVEGFVSLGPILVIGDIGLDKYTMGNVRRISPEAPVPVLEVVEEKLKLGMAANIVDNLRTLGVRPTLCGIIGEDRNAEYFQDILKEYNLSTDGLIKVGNRPTTFKERVATSVQQVCRVDYEDRSPIDKTTEKMVLDCAVKMFEDHGAVIVEDYGKGMFTEELIYGLIQKSREKGKLLTLDPSRITPPEFYRGATLLKPNLAEAQMMARSMGCRNEKLEFVADTLMEKLELEMLVITMGAEGMAVVDRGGSGELKRIPTLATEVYDVSGAGDTSISVLTASLLGGANLEEAAWIANCAAGVVVGKIGTATVNSDELGRFYERVCENLQ